MKTIRHLLGAALVLSLLAIPSVTTFAADGIVSPTDTNIRRLGQYSISNTNWRDQLIEILLSLNFTQDDTILADNVVLYYGTGSDFGQSFNATDMLFTGAAGVGLTLDLDSGSANTETFDITAYNMTLDATGNMLLIGNLDLDDGSGASPDITLTDGASPDGTLVIVKPTGSAATITSLIDGLTLAVGTTAKVLTLDVAGGNAAGEDLVLNAHNFGLTAAGAIACNQSTTFGTVGDDETLTFQAHAGSPDAGDDVIFDFDNWALTALGAMSWPGNAGSITTLADTSFTITAGDDGADAGEDVIIVSESWGVAASGDMLFDDDATDSPSITFTDGGGSSTVIHHDDINDQLEITAAASGVLIDVSTAGNNISLTTDGADGDDLLITAGNVTLSTTAMALVNATTMAFGGDVTVTDGTTDSPTVTWTDATAETLVLYKPDGAAASLVSSHSGMVISSTEAAQVITMQGQAGSPGAGDDFVWDFHNITLDALGEMTIPTTSKINIVDDPAGLEFNGVALTTTVARLNMASRLDTDGGSDTPMLPQVVEIIIAHSSNDAASGVDIPAGANILHVSFLITTDFDGTTPLLDIGFVDGDPDEIVDGLDIDTVAHLVVTAPTATMGAWLSSNGGDVAVTTTAHADDGAGEGTLRIVYSID